MVTIETKTEVSAKIRKPPKEHDEIATDNEYLVKRVTKLLEQLQLAVMEKEKKEKALFNGCWISNLIKELLETSLT